MNIQLDNSISSATGLTSTMCNFFNEAAIACLQNNGHNGQVSLTIEGDTTDSDILEWQPRTDEEFQNSWKDMEEAVEHGAYGITALQISLKKNLKLMRSYKGTGFDFWAGSSDGVLFQNKARVEVSGILTGDTAAVNNRIRIKKKQVDQKPNQGLPALISIVEFSKPLNVMVSHGK